MVLVDALHRRRASGVWPFGVALGLAASSLHVLDEDHDHRCGHHAWGCPVAVDMHADVDVNLERATRAS
jgi:hypothetical protein